MVRVATAPDKPDRAVNRALVKRYKAEKCENGNFQKKFKGTPKKMAPSPWWWGGWEKLPWCHNKTKRGAFSPLRPPTLAVWQEGQAISFPAPSGC